MDKPSQLDFDRSKYAWRPDVDYREHPEIYRVGKGEQGVLICGPSHSSVLPGSPGERQGMGRRS